MSKFVLKKSDGDHELENIYSDMVAAGFGDAEPWDFFTALGPRPDILADTWAFVKVVMTMGYLPETLKQMIALSVSRQNGCDYCAAVHREALVRLGIPGPLVDDCVGDPEGWVLPKPQRTIVQFALKAAAEPNSVSDEDFDALRDFDLTEQEIAEIVALAGLMNFINAWANMTATTLKAAA